VGGCCRQLIKILYSWSPWYGAGTYVYCRCRYYKLEHIISIIRAKLAQSAFYYWNATALYDTGGKKRDCTVGQLTQSGLVICKMRGDCNPYYIKVPRLLFSWSSESLDVQYTASIHLSVHAPAAGSATMDIFIN
jgi:hypothetical protein